MPGWQKTSEQRQRDNRVYGNDWRKARIACLRRARWRCEIKLDGCQGAASQVDHIDQADNDPQHQRLRATCAACHKTISSQQGNAARRGGSDPAPQPRTTW